MMKEEKRGVLREDGDKYEDKLKQREDKIRCVCNEREIRNT